MRHGVATMANASRLLETARVQHESNNLDALQVTLDRITLIMNMIARQYDEAINRFNSHTVEDSGEFATISVELYEEHTAILKKIRRLSHIILIGKGEKEFGITLSIVSK